MTGLFVCARAFPELIRLTETYYYNQEISRNPSIRQGKAPTGQIEIVTPLDGSQYFSRSAVDDVVHQLGTNSFPKEVNVLIGHLAFADFGRTDLNKVLDLSDHYGTLPVYVPIGGSGIGSAFQLIDDQHASSFTCDYTPKWPEIIPVGVEMDLLDEDVLNLPSVTVFEGGLETISNAAEQIAQLVSLRLRPKLFLSIQVKLTLPSKYVDSELRSNVTKVRLKWPTITSFRALHLFVGGIAPNNEVPVLYDPLNGNLEWENIPLVAERSSNPELIIFYSKPMFLRIDQPGEFYKSDNLDGELEIEIQGRLVSGLQVRIYNGAGGLQKGPLQVSTRLITNLRLILDDAFARRKLSPYQQLYFEGIIPDEMRIADIKTALADRGFRIDKEKDKPLVRNQNTLKHFMIAQRQEGPDSLELWIVVEGKRHETTRESQVPGGQTYTSTFESGELKVYMRGEFPGNSRILTEEMNALQVALRDRFDRLRAQR